MTPEPVATTGSWKAKPTKLKRSAKPKKQSSEGCMDRNLCRCGMSDIVRVSVLLVVLVCGLPGIVTGQERSGFWIEFDVGGGSTGTSASGTVGSVLSGDSWASASAIGLGWAVHPQLLVGVDLRGLSWRWWVGDLEGTLAMTNVSGILTYYPRASSGLYVKGGVGGSLLTMDVEGFGGPAGNSSHGLGFTTGTGYDVVPRPPLLAHAWGELSVRPVRRCRIRW